MTLPELQEQFIRDVAALGRPTVLLLINGGAIAVDTFGDQVNAIIEDWYPAQRGAEALFAATFGSSNPFLSRFTSIPSLTNKKCITLI
jgi:beta-glucosidase